MKIICKARMGSFAYGLSTPQSDIDLRSVFLHTSKSRIIGLERFDFIEGREGDKDEFSWELRHFLSLIMKTNTQSIELIYNNNWEILSDEFRLIQENKTKLMSTEKLFSSLSHYIANERRLMTGERTGRLGSKRFQDILRLQYSPKNAVNLLRLTVAGRVFFEQGYFPVDISKFPEFHAKLMKIKSFPEMYKPDQILAFSHEEEEKMKKSFDNRSINYKFDIELANDICCELYKPLL